MMLDVFRGDGFAFTDLVAAINKIPYVPTRIGKMGLFAEEGVSTLTVAIEMQDGVLTLVPTAPRGAPGAVKGDTKRNIRDFRPVHLPQRTAVMADEVQNIRAFGSQTEVQLAQAILNKKLGICRRDLDVTHEWQRMGALKGIVYDSDASVLYNYLTEFGVAQQTVDFALDSDTTKVRGKCHAVERVIEDALGGVMMSGVHAFVSPEFFDALVDHPAVRDTFLATEAAQALRKNQRMAFEFGDIIFEEYRGTIGGTRFIAAGEGYAFPVGVPDLFKSFFAPANYMETVNTMGLPFYAKGRDLDYNVGIEYQSQSNPLHICTRPDAVVKLTLT